MIPSIHISSYSIKTDTAHNILSVDFLINFNKPMSPHDYESVYQALLKFCRNSELLVQPESQNSDCNFR